MRGYSEARCEPHSRNEISCNSGSPPHCDLDKPGAASEFNSFRPNSLLYRAPAPSLPAADCKAEGTPSALNSVAASLAERRLMARVDRHVEQ